MYTNHLSPYNSICLHMYTSGRPHYFLIKKRIYQEHCSHWTLSIIERPFICVDIFTRYAQGLKGPDDVR